MSSVRLNAYFPEIHTFFFFDHRPELFALLLDDFGHYRTLSDHFIRPNLFGLLRFHFQTIRRLRNRPHFVHFSFYCVLTHL